MVEGSVESRMNAQDLISAPTSHVHQICSFFNKDFVLVMCVRIIEFTSYFPPGVSVDSGGRLLQGREMPRENIMCS
jgi:hypothetical protein